MRLIFNSCYDKIGLLIILNYLLGNKYSFAQWLF